MKYCTKCFALSDNSDACPACSSTLEDCKAQSSVKVTTVKGNLRAIVEPALKDKGIPCDFYNPEADIYNQINVKVNAETEYILRVPFEYYTEAFDICIGLGLAEPEDMIEISEDSQSTADGKTYDERFAEATGVKPKIFKILWIVLFIVVACLLIWGVDLIAALIKNAMGIPVMSKIISFLL